MAYQLPTKLSEIKDTLMYGEEAVVLIDLYVLHLGSDKYYFSACDTDIEFYEPGTNNPVTYYAQPIQRGKIRSTVDSKIDNVEIKISNVNDIFTSAIFNGTDFRGQLCEIIQIAYPASLGNSGEYRYVFVGDIDAPTLDEGDKVFTCQIIAKLPNTECGRYLMLQCNAEFANPNECGAYKKTAQGTLTEQTSKSTIYLKDRGEPTDFWTDGLFIANGERRRIASYIYNEKENRGEVILEYPFWDYPLGRYTIEQGCDKTHKTCINRFGNAENFGGFPSVPFELTITG